MMTGSELKGLVEQTSLTVEELCERVDVEAEKLRNLMQLGPKKLPLWFIREVRPVVEQYQVQL
ncbi:MAG: hypothetical protein ABEJ65_04405 [bacterium]